MLFLNIDFFKDNSGDIILKGWFLNIVFIFLSLGHMLMSIWIMSYLMKMQPHGRRY
jgi:hypothetical protein